MRLLYKFAIGLGALLTDIVLLSCCLYLTVVSDRISMEAVHPNYLLWIGLVVIGFLVNLFIVKKGRQLMPLLIWNPVWMIVTTVIAAFTFQCEPSSTALKVFVCFVLIIIQGHGISHAVLPQRASTQLTFLDALVVVFAIFLAACHMKDLPDVIGLQIFGFICVGYTLVSLIFLRTYEEQVNIAKGSSVASKVKVFGLLAVIVGVSCVVCGALTVMAKNAGSGLLDIILLMGQGIKRAFIAVGAACTRLFSRIPHNTIGDVDLSGSSAGDPTSEQTGLETVMGLPEWVIPLVGAIIIVFIAILVIRLFLKLRKEKIQISDKEFKSVEFTASELADKKPSWWERLKEKWKLRMKMRRERKSVEGLAMLIRKSGKVTGIEMQPDHSWHGYVLKLIPYGEECVLQEMSDYLKKYFYSGSKEPLSKEQYQKYATCLRHLKKPDKNAEVNQKTPAAKPEASV